MAKVIITGNPYQSSDMQTVQMTYVDYDALLKENQRLREALKTIRNEERKYTGKYWTAFINKALAEGTEGK